jgi:hypothetical protein
MTISPAPGLDLSMDWCPISAERSTPTRALVCRDGAKRVGTISLGLRNVDDDYPRVDFDGIKVNDESVYRDGAVSLPLIRAVQIEYPNAAIVGGPSVTTKHRALDFASAHGTKRVSRSTIRSARVLSRVTAWTDSGLKCSVGSRSGAT